MRYPRLTYMKADDAGAKAVFPIRKSGEKLPPHIKPLIAPSPTNDPRDLGPLTDPLDTVVLPAGGRKTWIGFPT